MLTEFFSDRLVPHVVEQRARPNEGIRRCTRYFLTSSICFGLVVGVAAASIAVLAIPGSTPRRILFTALTLGAFIGLSRGLTLGGMSALRHLVIRTQLVRAGVMRARYLRFLHDAEQRILLYRAGSGFILPHRLLQQHLSTAPEPLLVRLGLTDRGGSSALANGRHFSAAAGKSDART